MSGAIASSHMDELSVRIKLADNGVVITACKSGGNTPDGYNEETYVYKTLEEALSEIPSIVSVLKDGKDDDLEKRTASGKEKDEKMNKMIDPKKK